MVSSCLFPVVLILHNLTLTGADIFSVNTLTAITNNSIICFCGILEPCIFRLSTFLNIFDGLCQIASHNSQNLTIFHLWRNMMRSSYCILWLHYCNANVKATKQIVSMPNCDIRQSLTSVSTDNAFYEIEHIMIQNQFLSTSYLIDLK